MGCSVSPSAHYPSAVLGFQRYHFSLSLFCLLSLNGPWVNSVAGVILMRVHLPWHIFRHCFFILVKIQLHLIMCGGKDGLCGWCRTTESPSHLFSYLIFSFWLCVPLAYLDQEEFFWALRQSLNEYSQSIIVLETWCRVQLDWQIAMKSCASIQAS